MQKKTFEEILSDAIEREQAAHDFYLQLGQRASRPGMREVFEQFAAEELGHKAKLERVRAGQIQLAPQSKVTDLRIADYLAEVAPQGELDYAQALTLAMKREKASFQLYLELASHAEDAAARELFTGLAQEEARHKLRFEIEYDEAVLSEN